MAVYDNDREELLAVVMQSNDRDGWGRRIMLVFLSYPVLVLAPLAATFSAISYFSPANFAACGQRFRCWRS